MSKWMERLQAIGLVTLVPETEAPKAQPYTPPPAAPGFLTSRPVSAPPQVVDPEMAAKLQALDNSAKERLMHVLATDGAPLPEELIEIVETLADTIPDVSARYKTALKLMAKKGHTKEAILANYDKCLAALAANAAEFDKETQAAVQAKVGSKQQNLVHLEGQIRSRQEQIEALQKEIVALHGQLEAEKVAIGEESQKITLVCDRFLALYNVVRAEIEDQQKKVAATV